MQNTPCVCVHFQEEGDAVLHNQVKWSISGRLKWTQYYSTIIQMVSTVPVSSTATFLISKVDQGLGMPLGFHFLLVFKHFLSFFFLSWHQHFEDLRPVILHNTAPCAFCVSLYEIYSEIWKGRLVSHSTWMELNHQHSSIFFFSFNFFNLVKSCVNCKTFPLNSPG